jgi:ribosomal protein L30E
MSTEEIERQIEDLMRSGSPLLEQQKKFEMMSRTNQKLAAVAMSMANMIKDSLAHYTVRKK